jgi:hypothetical protein
MYKIGFLVLGQGVAVVRFAGLHLHWKMGKETWWAFYCSISDVRYELTLGRVFHSNPAVVLFSFKHYAPVVSNT